MPSLLRPNYPPQAVEIGDGYASAVRFQRRRSRPRLVQWHGVDLPRRKAESEGLGEFLLLDDELRHPLEELIAGMDRFRKVSLALPDTAVRSFFLEIENPIASARELRDMILFKITKLAPISVEGTALTYQRLRPRNGGGDHYLAQITSRRLITGYENFFAAKGIQLGLVESSTLASANLFEHQLAKGPLDYALLRVDRAHFNIALFRDGMLTFARTRVHASETGMAQAVAGEMRTLNLFAQDKLGSTGIQIVYVHGPGAAVESADLLESKDFPSRLLTLDLVVEIPGDLHVREAAQGALVAAAGAALRR